MQKLEILRDLFLYHQKASIYKSTTSLAYFEKNNAKCEMRKKNSGQQLQLILN